MKSPRLTEKRMRALSYINQNPGCCMSDLACDAGVSDPRVTVDALVTLGLVRCTRTGRKNALRALTADPPQRMPAGYSLAHDPETGHWTAHPRRDPRVTLCSGFVAPGSSRVHARIAAIEALAALPKKTRTERYARTSRRKVLVYVHEHPGCAPADIPGGSYQSKLVCIARLRSQGKLRTKPDPDDRRRVRLYVSDRIARWIERGFRSG